MVRWTLSEGELKEDDERVGVAQIGVARPFICANERVRVYSFFRGLGNALREVRTFVMTQITNASSESIDLDTFLARLAAYVTAQRRGELPG